MNMEIANETAPGGARLGKTSSLGNRDIAQNHLTPQAEKLNEFDAEIALALTASSGRARGRENNNRAGHSRRDFGRQLLARRHASATRQGSYLDFGRRHR